MQSANIKKVSKENFSVALVGYPRILGVDQLPTLKSQAVLIYLVAESKLNKNHAISKEKLVDLFWPGMPLSSALQNLRQTVYQIRKNFDLENEEDAMISLKTDRKQVWLANSTAIRTDVDWFNEPTERLINYSTAALLALYSKPFLENFHIPNTPEFDEWVDQCRNQLIVKYKLLLEKALDRTRKQQDNWKDSLLLLERLIQKDPYAESYHFEYIHTLAIQHHKNKAIKAYRAYEKRVREDLDFSPSPKMENLLQSILQENLSNKNKADEQVLAKTPVPRPKRFILRGSLILSMVLLLWWFIFYLNPSKNAPDEIRIAILPMENLTSKNFLADGLTDDILIGMTEMTGLKMVARQSSAQYKNTRKTPAVIGKELNVDYLLRGSVAQVEAKYKVNLKFLQANTGEVLWAETFREDTASVSRLHQIIIQHINKHLSHEFKIVNGAIPSIVSTQNPEAYQAYLKGRFAFYQAKPEALQRAVLFFQEALDQDPQFELAHAWLAWTYCSLAGSWGNEQALEMYPKVQAELRYIENSAPLRSMYYKILGWMNFWLLDRDQAEYFLRKSVAIDPNEEFALSGLAMVLTLKRHFQEAQQIAQQSLDLNPHFFWNHFVLGQAFYYDGKFDDALVAIDKGLKLFANHQASIGIRANLFAMQGNPEQGISYLEQTYSDHSTPPSSNLGDLGIVYATAGDTTKALHIANELLERHKNHEKYVAYFAAKIFSTLGHYDTALDLLEDAYRRQDNELNWVEVDLEFRPLFQMPRFQRLLKKISHSSSKIRSKRIEK